jgi:hypothetical protein
MTELPKGTLHLSIYEENTRLTKMGTEGCPRQWLRLRSPHFVSVRNQCTEVLELCHQARMGAGIGCIYHGPEDGL